MAGTDGTRGRLVRFFSHNKFLFLSYGIVFLIILISYKLLGIYPFGEFTITKSDQYHAIAPTIFDIRDKLMSGKNIKYSWYGAYGGNLMSTLFYSSSGLMNVISVFFSGKYVAEFVAVSMILRQPISAVTFYIFGREKFKRNDLILSAFSCMYALCAFVTAYHWNSMWMNAVIMLPIVALGMDRLVLQGKAALYSISLGFAIAMHYGAAINLCYFSAAYFLVLLLTEVKKDHLQKCLKFAWYSLMAGGMAAIALIPAFWTAVGPGTIYFNEVMPNYIEIYNSFFKFYVNQYIGMTPTVLLYSEDVANIYAGLLSLIIFPFFLFNKSVSRLQKLMYTAFLGIIFICTNVNILAYILHGMHFPSNMPHRFSFVYSFVLIITALYGIDGIKSFKLFQYIPFLAFSLLSTIVLYFMYNQNPQTDPAMFSTRIFVINIVFILAYYIIIVFMKLAKVQLLEEIIQIALIFVVFIELVINSYLQFGFMCDGPRAEMGADYYDAMTKITDELNKETGLYRAEFRLPKSLGDSRLYRYNGINAFASNSFYNLMIPFGYMNRFGMIFYNQTPVAASVMNNKYMFNRDMPIPVESPIFKFKEQVDNIFVYENQYALPFGYMVHEEIEQMGQYPFDNPYDFQEEFIRRATGMDFDIFKNMLAYGNISTAYIVQQEPGQPITIDQQGDSLDENAIPRMTVTFFPEESGYVSLFIRSEAISNAYLIVDGKQMPSSLLKPPSGFLDAGYVEKGTEILLSFDISREAMRHDNGMEGYIGRYGDVEVYAAQLDFDEYTNAIDLLMKGGFEITSRRDDFIKGTVTAEEDGYLFLTLGTDPKWRAKVNGIEQELIPVCLDSAYSLKLPAGEHSIELYYVLGTEYFIGLIVGAAFITLFVMSLKYEKKNGKDIA